MIMRDKCPYRWLENCAADLPDLSCSENII